MNNISFLVTYYDQEDQLRACINSIRKFYPKVPIILSQEDCDFPIAEDIKVDKHIYHSMRRESWAGACKGLMKSCPTDIGVFVEHDCVLLKPIDDLVNKLNQFDLVGIEEVYPGMRNSPGFANQNFFIIDVKKFIDKHGLDSVNMKDIDNYKHLQNRESGYGITQNSNNIYWLKLTPSGYGKGSFYGDYIHHMWFGGYRQRIVESDGIDRKWLDDEVYRFLKDYENSCIKCRL